MKNKYLVRMFWIFLFLVLWQVIALSGKFSPLIFPPLQDILIAFYKALVSGELIKETLYSFNLVLKGLFFGILIALILSALSIMFPIFESLVDTLLAIAHPLPGIALLPLIILFIGTGENSIIFIIIHSVLWPMLLNLITGFKGVPKIYGQIGLNYELTPLQNISKIMLPASFPYFLSGLKIGWARAWRALISAEMLFGAAGGEGGLGWFIFKKRVFMDTNGIFAGLIMIIVMGILVEDIIFANLEKTTVKKWGVTL